MTFLCIIFGKEGFEPWSVTAVAVVTNTVHQKINKLSSMAKFKGRHDLEMNETLTIKNMMNQMCTDCIFGRQQSPHFVCFWGRGTGRDLKY